MKNLIKVLLAALFLGHQPTRQFVTDNARDYLALAIFMAIPIIILIILGIAIASPMFSGIAFFLAVILFAITWLPAGAVNVVAARPFFPTPVRRFTGFLALAGFIGMMANDWLTFSNILIAILAMLVLSVFAPPSKALDRLISLMVVVMIGLAIWSYASPDSYRASVRHGLSLVGVSATKQDRFSIRNETEAATTYGCVLSHRNILYRAQKDNDGNIISLDEVAVSLNYGDVVLLCNHKSEVSVYQGMPFVEIRLPKENGSFVNGPCYLIEADQLEIGSQKGLAKEKDNKKGKFSNDRFAGTYGPGTYTFDLAEGETSGVINIPCTNRYGFRNPDATFTVYYAQHSVDSWEGVQWPAEGRMRIKNLSSEPIVLKVY